MGLKATFVTNGNSIYLENEIRNNRPVACGWLHHGTATKPTGGGHWGVICGFTPTHFIVNDPFGEGNMVNGGYASNAPTAERNSLYRKTGSGDGKSMEPAQVGQSWYQNKNNELPGLNNHTVTFFTYFSFKVPN